MPADLDDYIMRVVDRHLASRSHGQKVATITGYDKDNHLIKATLEPDGIETGWFNPHTPGFGIAVGQTVGDQIKVGFLDGNIETPVSLGPLYSDQQRPPVVESGEMIMTMSGATMKIDKTGAISHTTSGSVHVTTTGGDINLNSSGNVNVN